MRNCGVFGVIGLVAVGAASPALGGSGAERRGVFHTTAAFCVDGNCHWCVMPAPLAREARPQSRGIITVVTETEPNDSVAQAQFVNAGTGPGQINRITVDASFSGNDTDWFTLNLIEGDTVVILANGDEPGSTDFADTQVQVEFGGAFVQFAEDEQTLSSFFPPETPYPVNFGSTLSALVYLTAPVTGSYDFRVTEFGDGTGTYNFEIGVFRSFTERNPGTVQKFFIDFDGETITPSNFFGSGNTSPTFQPPFRDFLPAWGLPQSRESDLIDDILDVVVENLEDVRALNPSFDYELLNSRDDADTFGIDPTVSRVIVGGTQATLGIGTIGIAQWIDPGNNSLDDTAIVLLDFLSDPGVFNPANYAPGFTVEDWIARNVGNIVTHEFGHFISHIHTDPFNSTPAIMDTGGNLNFTIGGAGPNGIFGDADDDDPDFTIDDISGGGFFITGQEFIDTATAFNLSGAGGVCPGDVNGDGDTTTADITLVVSNLGAGAPGAGGTPGDANNDGVTTTADITFVVSNLGCTSP